LCGSNIATRGVTALLQMSIEVVFLLQALALFGVGLIYASGRLISRGQRQTPGDRTERTRAWAYGFGVAIVIYTSAISSFMGIGIARYRQTVDLLMIALCALGYSIWQDLLQHKGVVPDNR
jgi:hypothetical protein